MTAQDIAGGILTVVTIVALWLGFTVLGPVLSAWLGRG